MARGLLFCRAVLKGSDVLVTSWLVEDVSLVSATTTQILVTLTLENVKSVLISLLCQRSQFYSLSTKKRPPNGVVFEIIGKHH